MRISDWSSDVCSSDLCAKMSHLSRRVVSLVAAQDPSIINDSVDVTGALQAGNIAAGVESVTPVANKPTKYSVTGLNLQGRGPVRVNVTAETSVPGSTFREVTTWNQPPYAFSTAERGQGKECARQCRCRGWP